MCVIFVSFKIALQLGIYREMKIDYTGYDLLQEVLHPFPKEMCACFLNVF